MYSQNISIHVLFIVILFKERVLGYFVSKSDRDSRGSGGEKVQKIHLNKTFANFMVTC